MIFSELFKTKLNAMVYSRCMWNMEGKNRMQLMKGHLAVVSPTTEVRYDICIYESNTVDYDKVNIPVVNGRPMFELDRETYDRIAGGHFFFAEVVSNNQPLVPNAVFQTLEEAQAFVKGYQRDTRGLDVMYKHLDSAEAMKMKPVPGMPPATNSIRQPQEAQPEERQSAAEQNSGGRGAQSAAEDGAQQESQSAAGAGRPVMAPVNMTAYDRFCLDMNGISKRDLLRFQYAFVSPLTSSRYDAYVLQSRSKPYSEVAIPEVNGKPVVEFPEEGYNQIKDKEFYFIELMEGGHTLVPNVLFYSVEDAKRFLYNYKLDTRPLDVMFRKVSQEEAAKLERQPALEPERASENAAQAGEEPAVEQPAAAQPVEEETVAEEMVAEESAEPESAAQQEEPEAQILVEEPVSEEQPVAAQAAEEPAAGQTAEPEPTAIAEERPAESEAQPAEEETAAAEMVAEESAGPESAADPVEPEEQILAEEPAAAQQSAAEQQPEPVSEARPSAQPEEEPAAKAPRSEAMTPPISMAVYSRFCLDTGTGVKEDLYRASAHYRSSYSGAKYEINVIFGKSKPLYEVKIPEINGRKLFDLPEQEYRQLARSTFYFIEVTSEGQTTVLNKIFPDLETAGRYISAYAEDIRELDVMFRRITPQDAAKEGKVPGDEYVPEPEPVLEPVPEPPRDAQPQPAEAEERIEEQRVETKTYIDENGDEVEEEVVTVTKTLFEDDDEPAEAYDDEEYAEEEYEEEYAEEEEYADEYADEEYTEEEYAEEEDVEFVDEGEEEYAEDEEQPAEEEYFEEEQPESEPEQQPEEKRPERAPQEQQVAKSPEPDKDGRLYLNREVAGSVIYNQPIYAKEVYIQFPAGVTAVSSPGVSGYGGDLLAGMNGREEFKEMDFQRYLDEVNRVAEADPFEQAAYDAASYEDAFSTDALFERGRNYDDIFGDSSVDSFFGGDGSIEDIFGGLLRDDTDPYADIMRVFRTGDDETDLNNLF